LQAGNACRGTGRQRADSTQRTTSRNHDILLRYLGFSAPVLLPVRLQ
jgi:hypothetical protein